MQDRNVALAIAEDDRVLDLERADQLAQQLALCPIVRGVAEGEALRDRRRCRGRLCHLDPDGVLEELGDETGDLRRHGGREEQRLTAGRQQLADLFDVRNEAHVQHAVGLVDDEDLDTHQHQLAALEMIEHTAGRGDQDVGTAVEFLDLVVHRDAADQQRHGKLVVNSVLLEALCALRGEFAGGRQDQRARHARPGAAGFQPGDHRQHERRRLAGAGLSDPEDVAAGHRDRNRLCLDRGGVRVPCCFDCGEDFGAETELSEGCVQKTFSVTAFNATQPVSEAASGIGSAGIREKLRPAYPGGLGACRVWEGWSLWPPRCARHGLSRTLCPDKQGSGRFGLGQFMRQEGAGRFAMNRARRRIQWAAFALSFDQRRNRYPQLRIAVQVRIDRRRWLSHGQPWQLRQVGDIRRGRNDPGSSP